MISRRGCKPFAPMLMWPGRKKLCDGMVDVFADNYIQGGLKPREFLLGIAIAVVPTLDILNADREKALCVLCELLHTVSESIPKQGSKEKR